MNLRGWTTSSPIVYSAIPHHLQDTRKSVLLFGLIWNIKKVTLKINQPKFFEGFVTLKTILQNTSKVYDPLGLVSPVILRSKFLMRTLREQNNALNDQISNKEILGEWANIQRDFKDLSGFEYKCRIDCLTSTEIHTFLDSSAKEYSFIIYAQTPHPTHTAINPLFAKARITPPRKITIPKLELLAASLAAIATEFILDALEPVIRPSVFLWTDSKCTLARIYGMKILPSYEQNCIKQIRKVNNLQVKFVPGSQNPANIASRGATWAELQLSI